MSKVKETAQANNAMITTSKYHLNLILCLSGKVVEPITSIMHYATIT